MDAIATAREMLPFWVVWGNALLYPLSAFLLTLFGAWLGVWIASMPQRHLTSSSPWTERARQTFPARMAARRIPLFAFFSFGAFGFLFSGPCNRLPACTLGLLGGAAAYLAATCIRWRVVRRVGLGAAGLRAWLLSLLTGGLIFYLYLPILILLFVLLPDRFDTTALSLLAIAAALLIFYAWGGGLLLARAAGLARPAEERLQKIVEKAASKTGICPRAVYEVFATATNAVAFPLSKRLLFMKPILQVLDDEELATVSAHELGHLTEPLLVLLYRLSPLVLFTALAASRLIFAVGGLIAILVLEVAALLFVIFLILLRRLSQRMERRADRIAASDEETAKVYARTLEKMYQADLTPAVLRGQLLTHPHLYDRLLAAGVTPAYERPRPPSQALTMTGLIVPLILIGALMVGRLVLPIVTPRTQMRDSLPVILGSLALGGDSTDLSRLAYVLYKKDDKERAVVFYRAFSELVPQSVYGPANLAITLAALDRYDEANEAVVEAELRCRNSGSSAENRHLVDIALSAVRLCRARHIVAEKAAVP